MQIWCIRNGQQYGPYTIDQLRQLWASGHILPTEWVWCQMWVTVSWILGLPEPHSSSQSSVSDPRFGMLLPFQQKSTIKCKLPNNEHDTVVVKYYQCNGSRESTHYFCLDHNFMNMRCPIDNTQLIII